VTHEFRICETKNNSSTSNPKDIDLRVESNQPGKIEMPYNSFAANSYSQNGEDGVLRKVLEELASGKPLSHWCVEFGAWDGMHFSNTFSLVKDEGYQAVYIEGDSTRFRSLVATSISYPAIHPVNAFVSARSDDDNSLANILSRTPIPADFDVLSIDIDSYDLDLWEVFEGYAPKMVIIEINSTIPPGVIWRHGPGSPGNTFSATLNVALQKGYFAVCHTGNLILVRNDLRNYLSIPERFIVYPELLFLYEQPWTATKTFLPVWSQLLNETLLWGLSKVRALMFWRRKKP
jgi:hypothetical protein